MRQPEEGMAELPERRETMERSAPAVIEEGPPPELRERVRALSAGTTRVFIYGRDEATIADQCAGPDGAGGCPRASLGRPVACAERRIVANGWTFRVATDAKYCTIAALGVVRAQPCASPTVWAGER